MRDCAALEQIDDHRSRRNIACDFEWVPGYLHGRSGGRPRVTMPRRFATKRRWQRSWGSTCAIVDEVPFIGGPGVVFENQARIPPASKYLAGVARAIAAAGGHIYARSAAEEFSSQPLSVKANGHTISCRDMVLATYTPIMGNSAMVTPR